MISLLSEEEVIDIAKEMPIGSTKVVYSKDTNEIMVIVKEERYKVEEFKKNKSIGMSPYYLEDYKILQLSIAPSTGMMNNDSFISANISLEDPVIYERLKYVAEKNKGIEFYTVSSDLKVISIRKILSDSLSNSILDKQLQRYRK